jgi:DNA excision repair protein ERCC-2
MSVEFPYSFREGQREALDFIRKNIGYNICMDAPTGFGKTAVVLSALLPYPVIWCVRTGNEADRPIEELKIINERLNKNFFGFSFRGKKDMCLLAREKEYDDVESVTYLCKSKKKECRYYENLQFFKIKPEKPLLYSEIIEICRNREVCPYYLQRELLYHADVVSLSYNYIIHPGISWTIRSILPFDECFLVVDEAHNLRLAGNLNSDEITLNTLKNALKEIDEIGNGELGGIVSEMLWKVDELREDMLKKGEEERVMDIRTLECKHLNLLKKSGELIRQKRLEEGKPPRSSLYHLADFLITSLKNLAKGVVFIASVEKNNLRIERWDMRSAEILKDKWKLFKGCIFCSGTLKPIKAFSETVGLESWKGKSFKALTGKCKSLIIKGVSTRGEELDESEAERYVKLIGKFLKIDANLAIFSASYRIQNKLLPEILKISDKQVFAERQGMSGDEGRKLLDEFKAHGGVLVATMTGRFAEGTDFPGKELEGIFLIGIPFDRMTLRTQLYLDYYEELYGKEKGYYYAYVVPAMQRASQTLGRALRSKEDKALFVLGDERYGERIYSRLLPDFIQPGIVEFENAGVEMRRAWSELSSDKSIV